MPTKYLLPCPACGQQLSIEKRQAGQSATCACGQELAVPTLREIQKLAPASESAAEPGRNWSFSQGLLFAGGLLLVVGGLLVGAFYAYEWARIPTDLKPPPPDSEAWAAAVLAHAPPDEIYDHWKKITEDGLGHWHPPPQVVLREISGIVYVRMAISLVAAAIGAALIGCAFLLGSRRAPAAS